jgi:hypothetical protein
MTITINIPMIDGPGMMSVIQQDGSMLRVMVGTASVSFCHKHVL